MNGLLDIFENEKPIIGMIHLAGDRDYKISRALQEVEIYEENGVDGIMVENYHGRVKDVRGVLRVLGKERPNLAVGINILGDSLYSLQLAEEFGFPFVQMDSIQHTDIDLNAYNSTRRKFKNVFIIGGVRFKYKTDPGTPLDLDLRDAIGRCEAICTTGEGTGIETPLDKLIKFREIIGDFPLVVGAGVNPYNVQGQLEVADAAIVGSYFKGGNIQDLVNPECVREIMEKVREIR